MIQCQCVSIISFILLNFWSLHLLNFHPIEVLMIGYCFWMKHQKRERGGMINWYFVSGIKLWNHIIWQSLGLGKPFLKVFNLDYRIHLFLISVFPIIPFSNYFWHFPMFFISCFRIISDTSSPFSDVRQQKSCRLPSVSLSLNRNN